jgi:phospholipid-transporting ATPase
MQSGSSPSQSRSKCQKRIIAIGVCWNSSPRGLVLRAQAVTLAQGDGRRRVRCKSKPHLLSSSTSSLSVTMGDDFLRLVSQANPAARQYHPANGGYPPSSSTSPYYNSATSTSAQLDPFFDDEDDVPDSAFGRPAAMQSKESGLPLARSGAAPAGMHVGPDGDILQDWDDEAQPPPGQRPFNGSALFPGTAAAPSQPRAKASRRQFKWRWPWKKEEEVLTGERLIALNNLSANAEYRSNYVSTSKYNAATFLPKFLFGEFIHSLNS